MVTSELLDYIKKELQGGKNPEIIKSTLLSNKWSLADIETAFNQSGINSQSSTQNSKNASSQTNSSNDLNTPANFYPRIIIKKIENSNRFYAFPVLGGFIKFIILIPVFIEVYFLSLFLGFIQIINAFMVLFTGKYWDFAYSLGVGSIRLTNKIIFFLFGLTNKYPGFNLSINDSYSVDVDYPESPNKLYAIPLVGILIRGIALIPFIIYYYVIFYGAILGSLITSFAVFFTGKYPESTFELAKDSVRLWQANSVYMAGLSDKYPSFNISWNHKTVKIILISLGVILMIINVVTSVLDGIKKPSSLNSYPTKSSTFK